MLVHNTLMNKVEIRRKRLKGLIDNKYQGVQANLLKDWAKRNPKKEINQGELSLLLKNKSFGEKKGVSLAIGLRLREDYFENFDDDPNFIKIKNFLRENPELIENILAQCIETKKTSLYKGHTPGPTNVYRPKKKGRKTVRK